MASETMRMAVDLRVKMLDPEGPVGGLAPFALAHHRRYGNSDYRFELPAVVMHLCGWDWVGKSTCQGMVMISAEGAAGLSITRLLNLREKLSFFLRGCVPRQVL